MTINSLSVMSVININNAASTDNTSNKNNKTNIQAGVMGMLQSNDYMSKNIQNQIANAQQKLQDLSSNEEMSLEDKMKKRQEIQQEITSLNQQLRQHQIDKKIKQQSRNSMSMDDMIASTNSTSAKKASSKKGRGMSQAGMQSMISAGYSMKQAGTQGSVITRMQGQANVLESEIKQDAGRSDTEKKKAELADLQAKAESATEAQMSTLANANKTMKEAAEAEAEEKKNEKTDDRKENKTTNNKTNSQYIAEIKSNSDENAQESIKLKSDNVSATDNTDVQVQSENITVSSESGQIVAQKTVYTPIDIKL